MPWKTNYNEAEKYIELTYSGIVTPEELFMAFENSMRLSKEHNTLLYLADCLEMVGGHSVIDLYGLIGLFDQLNISIDSKEAVLMKSLQNSAKEIEFYETACRNRGFNVKLFTNRDEALDWLTA